MANDSSAQAYASTRQSRANCGLHFFVYHCQPLPWHCLALTHFMHADRLGAGSMSLLSSPGAGLHPDVLLTLFGGCAAAAIWASGECKHQLRCQTSGKHTLQRIGGSAHCSQVGRGWIGKRVGPLRILTKVTCNSLIGKSVVKLSAPSALSRFNYSVAPLRRVSSHLLIPLVILHMPALRVPAQREV